ncbi:MAG: hypothetical protein V4579_09170, partial [Pseudomonadota bacterium]
LVFDVRVVNGIHYEDITPYAADGFTPLPVRRTPLGESHWRYSVDISALPEETTVALLVPDCFAPINVFGDDDGLERRSFLAAGWALQEAAVDTGTPGAHPATAIAA